MQQLFARRIRGQIVLPSANVQIVRENVDPASQVLLVGRATYSIVV